MRAAIAAAMAAARHRSGRRVRRTSKAAATAIEPEPDERSSRRRWRFLHLSPDEHCRRIDDRERAEAARDLAANFVERVSADRDWCGPSPLPRSSSFLWARYAELGVAGPGHRRTRKLFNREDEDE